MNFHTVSERERKSLEILDPDLSGVLCALTIVISHEIPSSFSVSSAAFIIGRSLSLPMMMPTTGDSFDCSKMASPVSMALILDMTDSREPPVTVICPTLRCGLT